MKQIRIFDSLSMIMNMFGGLFIGNLSSHYNNWWILLLMIPFMFFIGFAVYFKNELKKKL